MKNRQTKTIEEMTMAERERDRLKKELDESEEQVSIHKCIRRLFPFTCVALRKYHRRALKR
jgi:hypothetical protein